MHATRRIFSGVLLVASVAADGAGLPDKDLRLVEPVTLNTPRTFPEIRSREEWQNRAALIREQILVSAGLWPMPEKPPLKVEIFGRSEHGDFSVEKVFIQTLPGFYLGGNLYRPLGKGNGPFPAVLNPHGHWSHGRLEDGPTGSIPARCITLARMGMVAFAYDMVGYNDTQFGDFTKEPGYKYHRRFGMNPADLLWNINLMGLQTWNSIRALDFLCSLPDVDARRLACTGASGGGTQTFMLGAIDDRLAVLAPTVMVSHIMQGGCSCENMPGLRIEYSNMEIAAVPAPKPQVCVAASGDWTKAFLTVEGPAIRSVYRLFDAPDQVHYKVLDFGHNYNQTTREEVYSFFKQHLLKSSDPAPWKETPYPAATNLDLRVFPDNKPPSDTLTIAALTDQLVAQSRERLEKSVPTDAAWLRQYKRATMPAWRHTLQIDPDDKVQSQVLDTSKTGSLVQSRLVLGHPSRGSRIPALLFEPAGARPKAVVVLGHPKGKAGFLNPNGEPKDLANAFLQKQCAVLLPDLFLTGELTDADVAAKRAKQVDLFFSTYNRTDAQERVQDLITAAHFARRHFENKCPVVLGGVGRGAFYALLAAPVGDGVVADCADLSLASDSVLLEPDLFVPGIRKLGGLEGAAFLVAPRPLLAINTAGNFDLAKVEKAYRAVNAIGALNIQTGALAEDRIAEWTAAAFPRTNAGN